MITRNRASASLITAAFLANASPAHASDFTGILTALASWYGVVMAWCLGTSWLVSTRASTAIGRKRARIFGAASGIALTFWWAIDPIAEQAAAPILLMVPIIAFAIASYNSEPGA